MDLHIVVIPVGEQYLAGTQLGGLTIKGRVAPTKSLAVQNLLHKLASSTDEDAALALELAMSGTTLTQALTDGGK